MDAPGRSYANVTLSGTDASSSIDCTRYQIVGFYTPGTLASSAFTFQASWDNSTFNSLMAKGGASAYSATVSTNDYCPIDLDVFCGPQYVKIVPGSSESAAVIRVVLKPLS